MDGFFSREETKTTTKQRLPACGGCGLHKVCNSPKFRAVGSGEKGILIIAGSVTEKEDNKEEAFIGPAYQRLRKAFRKYGVDLERDCRLIHAVCCYDPEEDENKSIYIESCRPNVWREINNFKPSMIFILGSDALESFLGHRWPGKLDSFNKWHGWNIPDREAQCWVHPIFHPEYIDIKEKNPAVETVWLQDIKRALSFLNTPYKHPEDEKKFIHIVEGRELYSYLRKLSKSELSEVAFDYETTGLKPHRPGHRIVTCAIADNNRLCYAFNMPTDVRTLDLFKEFLVNPVVRKIAANAKFETTWSKEILKVDVKGWVWDTMLTAHMLDNRTGITGLKFQAYVRFGITDYNSHIEPFLKGKDDKDANSFNSILKAPRKDILIYNGYDSLLELKLADVQMKEMPLRGYK